MDLDLIRKTAMCVKALETAADEKDYVNFLNPARELSDNVVRLVTLATQFNLVEVAAELRERVKQAMAEAKTLLREKSDASLDRFKGLLRGVAKVLVAIMNELKQIKASGTLPSAAPAPSASPVRLLQTRKKKKRSGAGFDLGPQCLWSALQSSLPRRNAFLHPLFFLLSTRSFALFLPHSSII